MTLGSANQRLALQLAAEVTDNEVSCIVEYTKVRTTGDDQGTIPDVQTSLVDDDAQTIILDYPEDAGQQKVVSHITLYNADSVSCTVTFYLLIGMGNSIAPVVITAFTVASGYTLEWSREEGWNMTDANGTRLATVTTRYATMAQGSATISGSNTSVTVVVPGMTTANTVQVQQSGSTGGFTNYWVVKTSGSFDIVVPSAPEIDTGDGRTYTFDYLVL